MEISLHLQDIFAFGTVASKKERWGGGSSKEKEGAGVMTACALCNHIFREATVQLSFNMFYR